MKKISLPSMTEAELAESIYWEAEQYIPFDIQDVNLDYQILDRGDVGGKSTMEVLLVAAKKEKIADYTGVIGQAGRVAIVMDVDAFALQNAYEVNYGIEADAVVVLLNVGASATNINILHGDQSVFTRDISTGGHAYTEALQKELNLPFDQADALKRGMAVDGVTFDDARPVLRAVTENVMLEVQKTFDFFKTSADSDRITRIVVSGGASRSEGFAEMLTERFQSPVELFDPFKQRGLRRREVRRDCARRGADGRGRRGLGVAPGGRPMIRINLLAVERPRAKKASARHPPGASRHDRREPDSHRDRPRHRLVVPRAAPAVRAHRSGHRQGRDRSPEAPFGIWRRSRSSRRARPSSRSASRSSSSCAEGSRHPCTCSTRSAEACPTGYG